MAGEVKHDYHLVDPSPWPAVGSLAVLIMMVSAVFFMKPDALLFGVEGKNWADWGLHRLCAVDLHRVCMVERRGQRS